MVVILAIFLFFHKVVSYHTPSFEPLLPPNHENLVKNTTINSPSSSSIFISHHSKNNKFTSSKLVKSSIHSKVTTPDGSFTLLKNYYSTSCTLDTTNKLISTNPTGQYVDNMACLWNLTASVDSRIKVSSNLKERNETDSIDNKLTNLYNGNTKEKILI